MQGQAHSHDCATTFKESLLILLIYFFGTILLTGLFISCHSAAGGLVGLLCGFFILLIFSARISGSHFNPAITLAFMFRRDTGRFSRLLGLLYIAAQYAGALLGAIIVYNLFQAHPAIGAPLSVLKNNDGDKLIIQAMIQELIGGMIITFLYLTQTEEKTKMSGDPAITTLIIAATYTAVVGYTESTLVMTGSPFNPAAALGLFFAILFDSDIDDTDNIWIFFIFSYVGAMCATLLFEYVYKRAIVVSEEHDEAMESPRAEEEAQFLESPTDK